MGNYMELRTLEFLQKHLWADVSKTNGVIPDNEMDKYLDNKKLFKQLKKELKEIKNLHIRNIKKEYKETLSYIKKLINERIESDIDEMYKRLNMTKEQYYSRKHAEDILIKEQALARKIKLLSDNKWESFML
jgi:CRISPR/Cas system-associated protein Cas10 (large subunit of type III CRISPR-Cas system)